PSQPRGASVPRASASVGEPAAARPAALPREPTPPPQRAPVLPPPSESLGLPPPKLPPEQRSRSFSKHTVMGVGPEDLQLPPPPRVPSFGALPDAARGTGTVRPAPAVQVQGVLKSEPERAPVPSPHATLHGVPAPSFGLANGHAPVGATPPRPPSLPAHAHASFERGGTLSPLHGGAPAQGASAALRDSNPHDDGEAEDASELVAPDEVPGSIPPAGFSSTDALVARLQAGEDVPVLDVPNAPRKLYLDVDENAPSRVEEGGSKFWLIIPGLVLLGGFGWLGALALQPMAGDYAEPGEQAVVGESTLADAASAGASDSLAAARNADLAAARLSADAALARPLAPSGDADPEPAPAASSIAAPANPAAAPVAASVAPARPALRDASTPARATAADKSPVPATTPTPKTAASVSAAPRESSTREPAPGAKTDREPSQARAAAAPPAPVDYSGWVSKGDQLFSRGDHEGAQKAFRSALSMRPAGSEANAGLGFALLSTGQAREALPYFDSAAASGYAEAFIGLGDTYRKLGQPSSAIEAYQAYLERLSKGSRADYARGQLEKLRAPSGRDDEPAVAPSPPASRDVYRPAGELTEPAAPSAPPPAQPSETTP
ncbi:MAG: Proline-rich protein, partial [Myxococcaceae bacterium]|nr:Proline-rich protein [Myxococcaceae bacterium]